MMERWTYRLDDYNIRNLFKRHDGVKPSTYSEEKEQKIKTLVVE